MILGLIFAVAGLIVLAFAADHFVAGAARLAVFYDVSPVVIGAVLIGFGTSAPEMVVSGIAAGQGDLDIGVGNIIGSNVANISLVLAAAAVVPLQSQGADGVLIFGGLGPVEGGGVRAAGRPGNGGGGGVAWRRVLCRAAPVAAANHHAHRASEPLLRRSRARPSRRRRRRSGRSPSPRPPRRAPPAPRRTLRGSTQLPVVPAATREPLLRGARSAGSLLFAGI